MKLKLLFLSILGLSFCLAMSPEAGLEVKKLPVESRNSLLELYRSPYFNKLNYANLIKLLKMNFTKDELNEKLQQIYQRKFDLFVERLAKMLLDAGANINAVNASNFTPLMNAVVNGNYDFAKFLIKNGANVNANNGIQSALTLLIRVPGEHVEKLLNLLLDNGADLTMKIQNQTPLELAKSLGRTRLANIIEKKIKEQMLNILSTRK
ncbi:ankyrin repeat domain-containing protein [Candidatus Dependentiae bacterium]|nr:ankyrin repeat domain-containing protein [Candidatus Dependentiae bacterium]